MAAEVKVTLNHENGIIEKNSSSDGLGLNLGKENENVENSTEALQSNGVSEDLAPLGEAEVEKDGALTICDGKGSNLIKKNGASVRSNNTKAQKDRKGMTNFPRNQKPNLSQSLSFPVRGLLSSGVKKSITDKQINDDGKFSNGSVNATSRLNHTAPQSSALSTNRRVSTSVHSSDGNANRVSSRRATLASMPSTQRSQWAKSGSGAPNNEPPPPEVLQAQDQNLKPLRKALPNKDDEDAHSTTSNLTPRGSNARSSSAGGFAFRCNERAEKRKEFFSKMEEKIHAKEMEKTNLQAKSKESQEQEIKQLRKSLTFKATPMPSFYQELAPPKVDLKKIPTTRPRSPKLGRQKTMPAAADNSSDGAKSPRISRASLDPNKLNGGSSSTAAVSTVSKKPVHRSLTKLPSQKSVASKPDKKPISSKAETSEPEPQAEKTCKAEPEEPKNVKNKIATKDSVNEVPAIDLPHPEGKLGDVLVEN